MTRTVLRGGRVLDGTGALPADGDVAIEHGRIAEVGPGLDGDTEIDVTGRTILPGFLDCHVHVVFSGVDPFRMQHEPFSYQFYAAARNLAATVDTGVTTVRDAGGADAGMKKALSDGLIEGPRLRTAITVLGQTGGHTDGWSASGETVRLLVPHPGRPDMIVDGPDEMRRRVRELVRAGADVIKICTSGGVLSPSDDPRHGHFSPEEIEVCVAEAAAAGLGVMAHAQGTAGIKNAVRAGVHSIEHGVHLDDEAIELMLARGTWLVPTLIAGRALLRDVDTGATRLPPAVLDKARAVTAEHLASIRRAVDAGVPIALGTDSGVFPHGSNLDELALLGEAGLSPVDALRAGTARAAQLLGLGDELGTVEPGKIADLVVVDGDPLDLTGYGKRITEVFQSGHLVRSR
ncbi:amidohydrolase family protein [Amycolatopsis rhabdoformis]|uniref:Amidohydrolase family protein n=1 Tax=Amycolatopsis rhabdoformis TaxID=1448059 RepID=A0ABZ1IDW0_9PSEU|nr:amidohydrolase family protein [Amycolatopsis rhabdoformis]WSE32655.1 amidohydrolase family protein [Amycolatopsis rhabdoformis]